MPELPRAIAQTLATIVRQPAAAGPPPEEADLAKALKEGTVQQQVGLLRRLYAAPQLADWLTKYEEAVLSALAGPLGADPAQLRADVRAQHPAMQSKFASLAPPPPDLMEDEVATEERTEPGVLPLGRFQAGEFLLVGDPNLLSPEDGKVRGDGSIGNALVKVHPGTWLGTVKMDGDRVSALQLVFEAALDTIEAQPASEVARLYIGGDAVVVLDAGARDDPAVRKALAERTARTFSWPWGCATESGFGTGTYPVFVRRHKGRVGWMLVLFDSDDEATQPDA